MSLNFEHFFLVVCKKSVLYKGCISKRLIRIANMEDPDQTASSEAIWVCTV